MQEDNEQDEFIKLAKEWSSKRTKEKNSKLERLDSLLSKRLEWYWTDYEQQGSVVQCLARYAEENDLNYFYGVETDCGSIEGALDCGNTVGVFIVIEGAAFRGEGNVEWVDGAYYTDDDSYFLKVIRNNTDCCADVDDLYEQLLTNRINSGIDVNISDEDDDDYDDEDDSGYYF